MIDSRHRKKKERKVTTMITRKVLDSMTIDHGRKSSGVVYRPMPRKYGGGIYWKRVESQTYCSGCLNRHDPSDCPHKG